jgi:predicted transcriptional regulator
MKGSRVQSSRALLAEMQAVARGKQAAPKDAASPSFESVEALMRLLTPANRGLLAVIRDRKPQSLGELAEISGRSHPNLTRTMRKLEAAGFVRVESRNRRKVPTPAVRVVRINVDPFSMNDRVTWG